MVECISKWTVGRETYMVLRAQPGAPDDQAPQRDRIADELRDVILNACGTAPAKDDGGYDDDGY